MTTDEMNFRKPFVGDMVCCFFEVKGKRKHTSAVVIEVYDNSDCLLVAPKKDGETLYRLLNMPFSTGTGMPGWHWPRKQLGCPQFKE